MLAVVTYGYLAPLASSWLAAGVSLAPGTVTASGGILAGSIAGGVSGAVTGGKEGFVVGMLSGALFGVSNAAWSNVGNALGRGVGEAATTGLISGGTTEMMGGQFKDGFWFAFAASVANSIYQSVVRYRATWASGGDAVEKRLYTRPIEGANNFGTQGEPLYKAGFWSEGGRLSRFANRIPGMNAIAGMHDTFVIHFSGLSRFVVNVPLMVPAVALTASALISITPGAYQTYASSQRDG